MNSPSLPTIAGLLVGIAILAWIVSRLVTARAIGWARRHSIVAEVNDRSSHTVPTPRVGGVGIFAGFAAAMSGAVWLPAFGVPLDFAVWPVRAWIAVAFALALAFALGLWDDRSDPPALAKLFGQLAIAALPAVLGAYPKTIHVPFLGTAALSAAGGGALAFVWVLLLMNVVNFMDGINGLAGRFAQLFSCGVLVAWTAMDPALWPATAMAAAMYGAAEGFLNFNLPHARTFMGDCGSQFVGAYAAIVTLLGASGTPQPASVAVLLLLVLIFAFDVLFTLAKRAARGAKLLQAHREHLYQRFLVANGENHDRTRRFVLFFVIAGAFGGGALFRLRSTAATDAVAVAALVILPSWYLLAVRHAERSRP